MILALNQMAFGEIRTYILDKMQTYNNVSGKDDKTIPMLDMKNKPMTKTLVIAGINTNKVTAQCLMYSLAIGTQIFPLGGKEANISTSSGTSWYYALNDQGVTIIELNGDSVKLHNLGMVPYTYVGALKK